MPEVARSIEIPAPPSSVWRWLSTQEGLRRWLAPDVEIDLRVGGAYRYVWRKEGEKDMGMGGIFRDIVPPERLVATERFDDAWYPGDALDTTLFAEDGAITRITITVLYASPEARDTARRSGMEHGMAAGYNRLEEVLSSLEG